MTTTLTDIAATAADLLDATDDFRASIWGKNAHFVRVYVQTLGRKAKDCGYLSINDEGVVDFAGLHRQRGTIRGIVEDAIVAAVADLPAPAPRMPAPRRCDECGYTHGHRMDCALA